MATNPQFGATVRNDFLDDIVTRLGATAFLEIFTGSQPASCAAADSGTLLAQLALANPVGTVSGGVLTFGAITDDSSANNSGTAAHFRMRTAAGGGTVVHQGTVGTSGCDLNLVSTSITSGQPVSVSSFTITAPGA